MEKQPELFGEFKEKQLRPIVLGREFFPEKRFTLTFTREKLILAILAFITVLAIMFALGVEYGKKGVARRMTPPPPPIKQAAVVPQPLPVQTQPQKKSVQRTAVLKPYVIQVATFKHKKYAQQEADKLRKKGYLITIVRINGLYELWVGEYSDPKEAKPTLNVLKKIYKDCRIRKR